MSRTVTRGLTALALGGLTSLTMVTPAHAVPCPPGTYPTDLDCIPVTITVTVVFGGQTFTITLTGWLPRSKVTIDIHSATAHLGTFTADGAGVVTATLKVPAGFTPGLHTITATGVGTNGKTRILSAPLTVKATSGTGGVGSGLPFTGFELGAASLLGAGLLGAGTIAVASGRKRKSSLAGA
jgi:hypothetical protein